MVRKCHGRPACPCPSSAFARATASSWTARPPTRPAAGDRAHLGAWPRLDVLLGAAADPGAVGAPQRRGPRLPQAQHAGPRRGHACRHAARGRGVRAFRRERPRRPGRDRARDGEWLPPGDPGRAFHGRQQGAPLHGADPRSAHRRADPPRARLRYRGRAEADRPPRARPAGRRRGADGAADPAALIPRAWGFRSAARFVSLFRPGEAEDVFQYYRPDAPTGGRSDGSGCRPR